MTGAAKALGHARAAAARWSPRGRRWRRFLQSFTLDPTSLADPLPAPGPGDFVICGCPRSGTSLLAAMLWQPPVVVTVMEPWDGLRMPPAALFRSLRAELRGGELGRGRLDVDAVQTAGRVAWIPEGDAGAAPVAYTDDCLVGVKWPSFWQYLGRLPSTRFLVCVRHPYEVLASFKRASRRLAAGFDYDVAFNRALNDAQAQEADEALRRVMLYERINQRVLAHADAANVMVVRYERWHDDLAGLRAELSAFLGVPLGQPVQVRAPQPGRAALAVSERRLVQEHCRSARAFGYALG